MTEQRTERFRAVNDHAIFAQPPGSRCRSIDMRRVQLAVPVPEKRTVRNGIIVGVLLLGGYVGSSMATPETVPRLTVLPRPDGEEHYVESTRKGCPPYVAYTFWNDTEGFFWKKRGFSHGDGCIPVAG